MLPRVVDRYPDEVCGRDTYRFALLQPAVSASSSLQNLRPSQIRAPTGRLRMDRARPGHLMGIRPRPRTREPCERGGRLYRGSRVEKIWTADDEATFLRSAPAHLHLPILMAL